jgi:hypothetical protein
MQKNTFDPVGGRGGGGGGAGHRPGPHFDLPEIGPAVLAAWFDVSETAIKHSVSVLKKAWAGPVWADIEQKLIIGQVSFGEIADLIEIEVDGKKVAPPAEEQWEIVRSEAGRTSESAWPSDSSQSAPRSRLGRT